MRHFLVFHYPEEATLAPSWAAGVAEEGLGMKKRLQRRRLDVQWKAAGSQKRNSGWIPPGEKHRHGATATTAMTHIVIQEQLDGKAVEWMEKVTGEQYNGTSEINHE